jgi:hypothetical protein
MRPKPIISELEANTRWTWLAGDAFRFTDPIAGGDTPRYSWPMSEGSWEIGVGADIEAPTDQNLSVCAMALV